jgi:hypothetical protein
MLQLNDALALFSLNDRQFARAWRRSRRPLGWLAIISLVINILFLGFVVIALIRAWQGGDWLLNYWVPVLSTGQSFLLTARLALWRDQRARLYAPLAELRETLRIGDNTRAPLIFLPADTGITQGSTRHIGSLQRPRTNAGNILLWLVLVSLLLILVAGALIVSGHGDVAIIVSVAILVPTGLVAGWCNWALRPFTVMVGEDGIRWRRLSGRRATLRWEEIRVFYSLHGRIHLLSGKETIYLVDGGASVLVWRDGKRQRDSARQASQRLASLIAEHTGKPLHDATEAAEKVLTQPTPEEIAANEPPSVTLGITMATAEKRRRNKALGVGLGAFLALVTISGSVEVAQPHYFELLYQRAHAHQPLYADPLTRADADWPTSARTSFNKGALLATDDTFKDESPIFVPSPRHVDNALYVVTARTGAVLPNDAYQFGGPGLAILGGGSGRNMLVFSIETTESWWWNLDLVSSVNRYQDEPNSGSMIQLGHDHDVNIHKGVGAINQIAILVRGGDLTFYVNGHYVARYYDSALAGCPVGLTLGGQGETASFTDFAIDHL